MGFYSTFYFSQEKIDTLQAWISKFHTLANLTYSHDGKFVTAKKWYANNLDTIVVMNTEKPNFPVSTIIKMNNLSFLKDNSLFSSGSEKVSHINLNNGTKAEYDNVRLSDALVSSNQYFILGKNGILKLYNTFDKIQLTVPAVVQYVTDKNETLFVHCKKGQNNQVINLSNNRIAVIYATDKEIKQLILSASGKHLVVVEKDRDNSNLSVTFVDTKTGKAVRPKGILPEKADFVDVSEIQEGKAYIIAYTSRIKPKENMLVDIWYANDNNLDAKQAGSLENRYWLWKPELNASIKLPNSYPVYHSVDSERYVLAFDPLEEFKNITLHPYLNLQLYDTSLNKYQEIFHQVTKDIVHSSNGRYIIALDPKEKKWLLYDITSKYTATIDKTGLRNPVFTSDYKSIYFESDDDLWNYSIDINQIKRTGITRGNEATIVNPSRKTTNPIFGFKMSMINTKKTMLIKIRNYTDNSTAYKAIDRGKIKDILPATANRIKEIKYEQTLKQFVTLEENFNMAPKIYTTKVGKPIKKEIFSVTDKSALKLRQDILSFTNSVRIPLKGILYYPANYSASKKYPMVVYIYQKQHTASNVYSLPSNEPTGFNRRTLLENGYFVYEPDIIFDSRGAGISALDCVHSALNAIKTNLTINVNKVGLTGHSMGGYETNFIATHSNRFAAFLSGAGFSDIVSSYFSYDYHEQKPMHNRFENGQFEMNRTFLEDKELYYRNNPINYIENVKAPVLVWNGMKDDIVVPQQAMGLFLGLKRNELPVVALFYVKTHHDLGRNTKESKDMNRRALDWWNYFLKGETDTRWISKQLKRDAE